MGTFTVRSPLESPWLEGGGEPARPVTTTNTGHAGDRRRWHPLRDAGTTSAGGGLGTGRPVRALGTVRTGAFKGRAQHVLNLRDGILGVVGLVRQDQREAGHLEFPRGEWTSFLADLKGLDRRQPPNTTEPPYRPGCGGSVYLSRVLQTLLGGAYRQRASGGTAVHPAEAIDRRPPRPHTGAMEWHTE